MKKPVVWVVKEQAIRNQVGATAMDYTPAMYYGDIQFVTRTDMPMHPGSSIRSIWEEDVAKFVTDYNPDADFIVATGQPTAIFEIGYRLGLVAKAPRYLVWRREENRYRVLDSNLL
jgi:hypothetical protein